LERRRGARRTRRRGPAATLLYVCCALSGALCLAGRLLPLRALWGDTREQPA
jgi:hypothetical protein